MRRAFSVDIDNIYRKGPLFLKETDMGEKNMGLPQKEETNIAFALNTEQHAEIIDGTVIIQDKTTISHNEVSGEIYISLKNFIKRNKGSCKVFIENIALYVGEIMNNTSNDLYMPDIMVACDTEGIKEDGVHCSPKLVVEVTSPSTRKYDYNQKRETYRKIGVEEYWIIDIQRHIAIQHLAKEDFVSTFKQGNEIEFSSYPGLKISVEI